MRVVAVSIALFAACFAPAPPAAPIAVPLPTRPAALAPSPDALALIEASATLDGQAVAGAPGAATIVVSFASWCSHCRDQLAAIEAVRAAHPGLRVIGVNFRAHEEYDGRGDAARVRAFVAAHAPWLIVVPVEEAVWTALGRPPKVPTLFVYDAAGALVRVYDRRVDRLPTAGDLDALVGRLGA